MSLSATTLSQRWGALFGGINEANSFSDATIGARADTIFSKYASLAQQRDVVDDLYENATNVRSDINRWTTYLFTDVETTLQAMCRDDTSRPKTDDLAGWFTKLNTDFAANGDCWTIPAVTATVATVTGTTNVGDGYLIASVVEPVDGKACYYAYAEVIQLICTADSYSGGTSAGSETWEVAGETAVDKRSYNWPKGSGGAGTLTTVVPSTNTLLTDGALDNWTTNTPNSWSLATGTIAGTTLFKEATTVYRIGGNCAKFTGDAATQIGIYQDLDTTKIKGDTNYAISFWYRSSSGSTTGTLRVALTKDDGTVITDNLGTSQSDSTINTAALQAANGTWVMFKGVLRTARNLPQTSSASAPAIRLELKFTTALSAHSVYVDDIIMSEMTQLYDGGPYHAMHGGNTPFSALDRFKDTITNSKGTTNFVRDLDRAFALADNGIRLTVTASASIADSLIT